MSGSPFDALPWFAVRLLFVRPASSGLAQRYVERITVWQCPDASAAMRRAGEDASTYARASGCDAVPGFAQSYELYDPPGHGCEVFSLMRMSALEPDAYVERFFPARAGGVGAADGAGAGTCPAWFAVRLLIRFEPGATSLDAQLYEERVSLWRCDDATAAVRLAKDEGTRYADSPAGEVVDGFAEVFALSKPPTDGAVVFSAARASDLGADEYVDRFYSTGAERAGSADG